MDETNQNNKKPTFFSAWFVLVILFLLLAGTFVTYFIAKNPSSNGNNLGNKPIETQTAEFKKFKSESEFREFLQNARSEGGFNGISLGAAPTALREQSLPVDSNAAFGMGSATSAVPDRVSQTNVQVMGIDEPDILKNNNKNIFYALRNFYIGIPRPMNPATDMMIAPEQSYQDQTQILNAFPPDALAKVGAVDKSGDLLLYKNTLVIQSYEAIYGYDVSNPASPQEKWKIELKDGSYVAQSRLYNDKLYLVLQRGINIASPCPLRPAVAQGKEIVIDCAQIYHPAPSINADATFTALKVNPEDGSTEKTLSFIGSSSSSTLYMSPNALYVAYTNQPDMLAFLSRFAEEKASDLIPEDARNRIKKLKDYDISYAAKMTELTQILQAYFYGQGSDDQLKKQTELENRMKEFAKEHKRDLTSTQIVKIGVNELDQQATAIIPGTILNQFSLDEYRDDLRVAVTVGGFAWNTSGETANDLYILSKDLRIRGEIKDMGVTERVYSARFMEDKGYLVTFKQTDPFYVLDLANPENPQIKGELKIPGFSSYLHPLKKDLIVGIGREENSVKASLFDVSNPAEPKEISKYTLKDYTSDILQTHHAFLHDPDHEIFFVPGVEGGYILSYKNSELSLAKAVATINPQRALYMNDYLYIVGTNEIVVYDEKNWNEVKRLKLERPTTTPAPVLEKPLPVDLPQTRSAPAE